MKKEFTSSRDIIIRTQSFDEAANFYGSILGLPKTHNGETLIGFESGAFCIYIEKGEAHSPVFEFLVPDLEAAKSKLITAGCTVLEENSSIPRCYIKDPFGMVFNIGGK